MLTGDNSKIQSTVTSNNRCTNHHMRTFAKPSSKNHLIETTTNLKLNIWTSLKDQSTLPRIFTIIYHLQRKHLYIKREITKSNISKGLYDEKKEKNIRNSTWILERKQYYIWQPTIHSSLRKGHVLYPQLIDKSVQLVHWIRIQWCWKENWYSL